MGDVELIAQFLSSFLWYVKRHFKTEFVVGKGYLPIEKGLKPGEDGKVKLSEKICGPRSKYEM